MAKGRCSGCGYENVSSKKVAVHSTSCAAYVELYKTSPHLALDAEEQWVQSHSDEALADAEEKREASREEVRRRLQERSVANQEKAQQRWREPTEHQSIPASAPERGVLINRGRTPVQRAFLDTLAN